MLRFIFSLLFCIPMVAGSFAMAAPLSKTHVLFTDPFEDSDDSFAILAFIDEMTHSHDNFVLVTANEILDTQGRGLRAMALYQWLTVLAHDVPELNQAMQDGRLEIVQGQSSQRFQREYNQFITDGTGDTHFYNPSLVRAFYQNPNHPEHFQTVRQLRNQLIQAAQPLVLLGIGPSNDVALLLLDAPTLFRDDFVGQGPADSQITQAREYYQQKLELAMTAYRASSDAQQLVANIEQFWQMSGGVNGPEEYNEKQSRIATDFLNHVLSAKQHGFTPINSTALLHPILEVLKNPNNDVYAMDEQVLALPALAPVLTENLLGRGQDGIHRFPYPGFFDKRFQNMPISSLNHDTLALVEAKQSQHAVLRCRMEYGYTTKVVRTYRCTAQTTAPMGFDEFELSVSEVSNNLLFTPDSSARFANSLNQQTDAQVMDSFYQLFSARYNQLAIFDFDCTITVDESFKHPVDSPDAVRSNTKQDIAAFLRQQGALFAINSFIDAPDNVLTYLASIYGETPTLVKQEAFYLFNKKRNKDVVAFYLGEYRIKSLPMPVLITSLPKLNPIPDPVTGEKNIDYHMAIEVLEGSGKNIPSTEIARRLYESGYVAANTKTLFYDDNKTNAEYAAGFELLGNPMRSFEVTPHIKTFEARELPPLVR